MCLPCLSVFDGTVQAVIVNTTPHSQNIIEFWSTCMQEAQAALLAKEDELAMLRRDLQELTAQLQKQSSDSAAQPDISQQSAAAHSTGTESKAQHSPPKPDAKDTQRSRKAGESGLPSPSLPATPHSPVDSPQGEPQLHAACCVLNWLIGSACWAPGWLFGTDSPTKHCWRPEHLVLKSLARQIGFHLRMPLL